MGTIIQNNKHYLTRLPLCILVILLVGLGPVIVGMGGAWMSEMITGEPCHEGNCSWGALPWLALITMPVAGLGFLVLFVLVARDSLLLMKK